MIIQRAGLEDVPEIAQMSDKASNWFGTWEKFMGVFNETYFDKIALYKATENEKMVGFIMAMPPSTDYQGKNFQWFKKRFDEFLYVDRVFVNPITRREGLGSMFYKTLLKEWNNLPLTCEISIEPPNETSFNFHDKLGFEEVGTFNGNSMRACYRR